MIPAQQRLTACRLWARDGPSWVPDVLVSPLSCPVSTVGGMSVRLPIGSEAKQLADDRAWPEAALKTTVDHTLMRGLATAGPCSVSGLPRSRSGRRWPAT